MPPASPLRARVRAATQRRPGCRVVQFAIACGKCKHAQAVVAPRRRIADGLLRNGKLVSDAWETGSVPERRDQETAATQSRVSMAVKIVFAFEKIVFEVFVIEKIVLVIEKIVSVVEKIVFVVVKIVFATVKIVFVPVKIVSKLENIFTATERMVS